ncbi:MAG: hypothetical protein J7641_21160 [Cyanobacteria bacterium SID2]|nr:hypothetical protein [Cyanobacteria bacterium SID2]MBP0006381.1 hypothetical protein [Cyanobacteria bacterium SBC]
MNRWLVLLVIAVAVLGIAPYSVRSQNISLSSDKTVPNTLKGVFDEIDEAVEDFEAEEFEIEDIEAEELDGERVRENSENRQERRERF